MDELPDSSKPFMTPGLSGWRRRTDGVLLVLAVASLPLLIAEIAARDLNDADQRFLFGFNVTVAIAFVTDLIVELVVCRHRRAYVRSEWLGVLVAVAQLLAVAPALAGLGILRSLRAVRPGVALGRVVALAFSASRSARDMLVRKAAGFALWAAAFTWLSAGVAFMLAEDRGGREVSLGDGMWWSISTITTVGYGDIYPVTTVGRFVAGLTMLVGISAFAVVTAKVAELLVRNRTSDVGAA